MAVNMMVLEWHDNGCVAIGEEPNAVTGEPQFFVHGPDIEDGTFVTLREARSHVARHFVAMRAQMRELVPCLACGTIFCDGHCMA